jgi:hypothetical protein
MPIPFTMDWVIDRSTRRRRTLGAPAAGLLRAMGVSEADVRAEWPKILDHKWYMSERMGRDVGFTVAMTDYFENVASRGTTTTRSISTSALFAPVYGLEAVLVNFVETLRGRHLINL